MCWRLTATPIATPSPSPRRRSATPRKSTGASTANLISTTTGAEGDFVIQLIDVYPAEVSCDPKMGGYQLRIDADIKRGRCLERFTMPEPVRAGEALAFQGNFA